MRDIPVLYYCPHCDYILESKSVIRWVDDDQDRRCCYCNNPVESEPDPNEGPYDTLEEHRGA